jgi:septal ring-binding cell division protein DamX
VINFSIKRYYLVAAMGLCLATPLSAQTDSVVLGAGALESRSVTPSTYDEHYTIQIGAFSSQQQAVDFAKNLKLPAEQMGVARILVNENILYVLAYGMYLDKEQARVAADKVCGEQSLDGCWARSLRSVRELSQAAKDRDASVQ